MSQEEIAKIDGGFTNQTIEQKRHHVAYFVIASPFGKEDIRY